MELEAAPPIRCRWSIGQCECQRGTLSGGGGGREEDVYVFVCDVFEKNLFCLFGVFKKK